METEQDLLDKVNIMRKLDSNQPLEPVDKILIYHLRSTKARRKNQGRIRPYTITRTNQRIAQVTNEKKDKLGLQMKDSKINRRNNSSTVSREYEKRWTPNM